MYFLFVCFLCLFVSSFVVFCFVSVYAFCVCYLPTVVCFWTSVVTSFQFLCTAAVENYLYEHNLVFFFTDPIHGRIFGF